MVQPSPRCALGQSHPGRSVTSESGMALTCDDGGTVIGDRGVVAGEVHDGGDADAVPGTEGPVTLAWTSWSDEFAHSVATMFRRFTCARDPAPRDRRAVDGRGAQRVHRA